MLMGFIFYEARMAHLHTINPRRDYIFAEVKADYKLEPLGFALYIFSIIVRRCGRLTSRPYMPGAITCESPLRDPLIAIH